MTPENQLVKIVDFFRKEKHDMFYEITYEKRELKRQYIYARGSESYDDIITVKIGKGAHCGVGECSPFPSFFNWPLERVLDDLKGLAEFILSGRGLGSMLSSIAAPARSGIDLALIDLKCHQMGKSVFELFDLDVPNNIVISQTVEYESLSDLRVRLKEMAHLPILKVKLGSDGLDENRLSLVHQLAPHASIVVDVNEGWTLSYLKEIMPLLLEYKVKMLEQPLKRGEDLCLAEYESPIPIYADESFMSLTDLDILSSCYGGFNVKLDKVGGFTSALRVIRQCKLMGKAVMVGCLGGTSLLSTAGFIVAQFANFVDLDNHLWLCQDRQPSLGGEDGIIRPPQQWLWGATN